MTVTESCLRQLTEQISAWPRTDDWRGTLAVLADHLEDRGHPFAEAFRVLAAEPMGWIGYGPVVNWWHANLGRPAIPGRWHYVDAGGATLRDCLQTFARQYRHMAAGGEYVGSPAYHAREGTDEAQPLELGPATVA